MLDSAQIQADQLGVDRESVSNETFQSRDGFGTPRSFCGELLAIPLPEPEIHLRARAPPTLESSLHLSLACHGPVEPRTVPSHRARPSSVMD